MKQSDYLLGRETFKIWENYWPNHNDIWPGINGGMKYVMSETIEHTNWAKSEFISSLDDLKNVKKQDNVPDLQVWGSGNLIQTLLNEDLVDELRLKIYPLTLGQGKKVFGEGTIPAAFTLVSCSSSPSGLIFANYKRAGDVKTGNVAEV